MSTASIALNRFGYGLRAGEKAASDPQSDLVRQLQEFDPRAGPLAGRPDSSGEGGEIIRIIRENRRELREKSAAETSMSAQMSDGDEPSRPSRKDQLAALPPELRGKVREAYGRHRRDVAMRMGVTVASPTPFAERLVHFWANHFSVSAGKPGTAFEVGNHEFNAIRPHVTGKFSDMLKAAALHPAMLLYLDQFQSVGPNSPFGQRSRRGNASGRQRGLNENLAREILELHTLGVDGGYSQADVTEFARALTGWTVPGLARVSRFAEDQPGGAAFISVAHEPGTRKIRGRSYPDTEERQAMAVLDDLAAHPATARFIATKLARHFTGDNPAPTLIKRLEEDFRSTGGDLGSLARTLVAAPESWVEGPVKFRRPIEWFASVLRFTGADSVSDQRLFAALRELGQVPWRAPSPAGFDDVADSWAGPDALLRRVELAERIARNVPTDAIMERAQAAFPGALSANTRTWLSRAESETQAMALFLVSPEMMRR